MQRRATRSPRLSPSERPPSRLGSLDALRGLAALAVVLFHYTTNLRLNYPQFNPPIELPHGHFGVELFFVVSGFVIFMSLARVRSVAEFAIARVGRLYPAYWAAVLFTSAILSTGGLPDRALDWTSSILNLSMLQEFFGARHVDGVYWTLSRELVFYLLMGALLRWKKTDRVHAVMGLLLLVQAGLSIAARTGLPELRHNNLASMLLFPYIHLFSAGIALYGIHRNRHSRRDLLLLGSTVLCELLLPRPEGGTLGHLIVLACMTGVGLVATDRLRWLATRPLLWLGSISYALYLVHQNIGYWMIHRLTANGISLPLSLALALGTSLVTAHLLRNLIEEPGQQAIKAWWKRRQDVAAAQAN